MEILSHSLYQKLNFQNYIKNIFVKFKVPVKKNPPDENRCQDMTICRHSHHNNHHQNDKTLRA